MAHDLGPQVATLSAVCWCERTEVDIPVQWVSEARTASCGPRCGPGCPSRANEYNCNDLPSDPTEVAATGKKTKMKRFRADKYDPRTDSSFNYTSGGARVAHPTAVILEVHDHPDAPKLCPCGCAEAPRGKGATFGMGHDARLKGKLTRAAAAGSQIVLTDTSKQVVEVLDPLEYAARFSTAKLDWKVAVAESASRASGTGAEQAVMARALGPQIGDEKLIRVGRWDKTGKIVAIYDDGKGGTPIFEYADSHGEVRRVRQHEDGKYREVPAAS